MTEPERAWVGALLEGEGSVYPNGGGTTICVANTDLELISALLRLTGVGCVSLQTRAGQRRGSGTARHDLWLWTLHRHNDVYAVACQCTEYSQKAQRAMKLIEQREAKRAEH